MMTESTLSQKSEQSRHLSFIIYLLMLGAFVIFFRLGDRDMWNGLESESAIAGWDMVETGRILVPHFSDQPFVDNRPPGAWWLIAATYKLTGVRNTWTARCPRRWLHWYASFFYTPWERGPRTRTPAFCRLWY